LAAEALRAKYIGKSVAHYFPRGAANPIMYVKSCSAGHAHVLGRPVLHA
jgi:hypothetical protein